MIQPFERLCICDTSHPYYKNYCYATHVSGEQIRIVLEDRQGGPVWLNTSQVIPVRLLPQPVTSLVIPEEPPDPFAPRPRADIAVFDADDEPLSSYALYDFGDIDSSLAMGVFVENTGEKPLVLNAWALLL